MALKIVIIENDQCILLKNIRGKPMMALEGIRSRGRENRWSSSAHDVHTSERKERKTEKSEINEVQSLLLVVGGTC